MVRHRVFVLVALAASGCGAVEQSRLRRGGADDTDFSKMPEAIQGMLTGTMLLAQALPHHGAPPSKVESDQMEEAGQLLPSDLIPPCLVESDQMEEVVQLLFKSY